MKGGLHTNQQRRKAKSGCRTCKTRKIKCDEGRPACRKCVSTGRTCGGYGIWGGGGDFYLSRRRYPTMLLRKVVPCCLLPHSSSSLESSVESEYLQWFMERAARKITGVFVLRFWDTLILQASAAEPAVLHALLTLSAVHKRGVCGDYQGDYNAHEPRRRERFILKHYTTAIHHLHPHFLAKDKSSIRIALITCIIFVCLEFLRGRFETAENHLESGLKVLKEIQEPPSLKDSVIVTALSDDPVDDWLTEAFSRLYVQVGLFKWTQQHPSPCSHIFGLRYFNREFRSFNDAWQPLERCLQRILSLSDLCNRQHGLKDMAIDHISTLFQSQQDIQNQLMEWHDIFDAFKDTLQRQSGGALRNMLLSEYYTMANIMVGTCLRQDDEFMFESYTSRFMSILHYSACMQKINNPDTTSPARLSMDMEHSFVDIGWIPPLYYTALKCRIPRIRLQAIRLIECGFHREGIWDSRIAASVARKVKEIEEGDFYDAFDMTEDIPLSSPPDLQDLSLPRLPHPNRICESKVLLPDNPTNSVVLSYRKYACSEWKSVRVYLHPRLD